MLRQPSISIEHPPTEVEHNNYCDLCGAFPMIGARYKCLHCVDFDVCSNCVINANHYPGHFYVRLVYRAPLLEGRITPMASSSTVLAATPSSSSLFGTTTHHGVFCDVCNVTPILGTRIKAVHEDDWDCCWSCLPASVHCNAAVVVIKEALASASVTLP